MIAQYTTQSAAAGRDVYTPTADDLSTLDTVLEFRDEEWENWNLIPARANGASAMTALREEFEMSMEEVFGKVISSYTRAQAIEEGVLVSLNDPSFTFRPGLNICAEAGIKFPVAMTIAAFAKTVSESDTPLPPCQDISGRLWDVLSMFKWAAKRGGSEIRFPVTVINWVCVGGKRINRTKRETVILKALCGPGDNGEPVITIMLPDED